MYTYTETRIQDPLLPQLPVQGFPSSLDCCLQNIPPLRPFNGPREERERKRQRERWEGVRITINRIMRQGPVLKDAPLRTVEVLKIFHLCLHVARLPFYTLSPDRSRRAQQPSKSSRAHKSLFFDLCSNSEPALPSTAGTANERQQKTRVGFNYRIM